MTGSAAYGDTRTDLRRDAVTHPVLLTGGMVVSMDAHRRIIGQTDVLLKDGFIVAVETIDGRDLPAGTEVVDVRGRALLPGFIDCHSHSWLNVLRGVADDRGPSSLYDLLYPLDTALTSSELVGALSGAGLLESMLGGTTTIVENGSYMGDVAEVGAALGLRISVSQNVTSVRLGDVSSDGRWMFDQRHSDASLQRALELVRALERHPSGRATALLAVHATDTCSRASLEAVAELADELDLPVGIHLAQTVEEVDQIRRREACTPVELLAETGLLGRRLMAAHCLHLSADDIDLLGSSGSHVVHNPVINAKRGKVAPIQALKRAGCNIALGTDNFGNSLGESIRQMIFVQRILEESGTSPLPMEALEAATVGGARALGRDDQLGSIEVGKRADLLVFNLEGPRLQPMTNVVANIVYNATPSDIERVYIDGALVAVDGAPTLVNERELLEATQQANEWVWRETYGRG